MPYSPLVCIINPTREDENVSRLGPGLGEVDSPAVLIISVGSVTGFSCGLWSLPRLLGTQRTSGRDSRGESLFTPSSGFTFMSEGFANGPRSLLPLTLEYQLVCHACIVHHHVSAPSSPPPRYFLGRCGVRPALPCPVGLVWVTRSVRLGRRRVGVRFCMRCTRSGPSSPLTWVRRVSERASLAICSSVPLDAVLLQQRLIACIVLIFEFY